MNMRKLFILILMYLILPTQAYSKIIFESAVGPFDAASCCGGSAINSSQFIASVFTLDQAFIVDSIGENFNNIPASPSFASFLGLGGEIFGALVNLNYTKCHQWV